MWNFIHQHNIYIKRDMIQIDFDERSLMERIKRALPDSPEGERMMRRVYRTVITKVQREVMKAVKDAFPNDQREIHKAVRKSLWKRFDGGVVTIAGHGRKSRGGARHANHGGRKRGGGQRGGNRRGVSAYTLRHRGYMGEDLAYVLRMQSIGTDDRYNRSLGSGSGAYRGRIRGNRVFERAVKMATSDLGGMIEGALRGYLAETGI